jgi:hypothetical protein
LVGYAQVCAPDTEYVIGSARDQAIEVYPAVNIPHGQIAIGRTCCGSRENKYTVRSVLASGTINLLLYAAVDRIIAPMQYGYAAAIGIS